MAKRKHVTGYSSISKKIYSGTVNKDENMWVGGKHDVTDAAVSSVAEYLFETDQEFHFDVDGNKYVLTVLKRLNSDKP